MTVRGKYLHFRERERERGGLFNWTIGKLLNYKFVCVLYSIDYLIYRKSQQIAVLHVLYIVYKVV